VAVYTVERIGQARQLFRSHVAICSYYSDDTAITCVLRYRVEMVQLSRDGDLEIVREWEGGTIYDRLSYA